ncbi:hypothetical protein VC03_00250 [Sneathia vaginalis]|uniref:Uncharacterized protein n=1 Tax=Sneathia vaginalis TaxID=187101 RepID=A0A0E3UU72_9FUSO|nr:hypothetical protein [Sneathia vaginalis]AKC95028.1 hypothetical protein VC03_00250 [Sneathia vaginalis]
MKKILIGVSMLIALNTFSFTLREFYLSNTVSQEAFDKNTNAVNKKIWEEVEKKAKEVNGNLQVKANNDYFKSFLITSKDKYYGLTFDSKTGEKVNLKDLFVKGYADPINGIIKERIADLGITDSKFNGISTWFNQEYYLEDFTINILLNNVTSLADKNLSIPIYPIEVRGIIK